MRTKARKPGASYAIGYGRPPTSSQFQPGQSGNPKGQPKGARNASTMARDALERPINVKVNRTWRKMSVRKAAYNRLAEKAVAGDAKALDFLLSLESAECPPQFDPPDAERSAAKDLEILQDFFNRRRAGLPQQEQDHDPERGLGKPKRGSK